MGRLDQFGVCNDYQSFFRWCSILLQKGSCYIHLATGTLLRKIYSYLVFLKERDVIFAFVGYNKDYCSWQIYESSGNTDEPDNSFDTIIDLMTSNYAKGKELFAQKLK